MAVVTLLNAVSANTTGPVAGLGTPYGNLTLSVSVTGTVSALSVQLLGSNDSFNWADIGSAITSPTAGTSVGTGVLFQYFQATLSGYSGTGTVSVELAYSLEAAASGGGGPPSGAAGGALTGTYPNPGLATVTIGEGGTGQTAQQAAINALTGTQSAGTYLRSNGTNASLSAIQAADLPAATTSAQGAVILDGTAGDIQALGTQAAGSSTKAAAANHVHPWTAPSVITATNAAWPIPAGAAWLEITAVGGGGQGGGGGSMATSTLTSALTNGSPVTSLAFTANPQAFASGATITVVSGGNNQTFTTTGAGALNATTVTVTSVNANFSYPAGSAVNVSSWMQDGAGGGGAGVASTQVVAAGASTTLSVTIGAGGSAAGGGGANTGATGAAGSNGTSTTVTGTGISVTGFRGLGGGASAASSATGGSAGIFGGTTAQQGNFGPGQGGYLQAGGPPSGLAAGGGGAGGTATFAVGGNLGGGAGTAIAGGAVGTGGNGGSVNGTNGGSAAANTGAGGGGGSGAYCGGTGGSGGAGGSGFVIIRVVG